MAGTLTVQNIEGPSSGANANKVIIPSGQTLYAPGHVLQVVSTTKTDTFSTTVGMDTPVLITGLTATLTPTSASSKVLVFYDVNFGFNGTATTLGVVLDRGGTAIGIGDAGGGRPRVTKIGSHEGSNWNADTIAGSFLDSPNTTSATTYGVKIGNNNNSSIVLSVNYAVRDINSVGEDGRSTSTITLMEIAQ